MDYNSENPIYPKLTTYDTRRLHDIQHKLNAITTFLHCTWDVIDETGLLDDDTKDAVSSFQQWVYLSPTGELDSFTEMKIDDVYRWSQRASQSSIDASYDYQLLERPTLAFESLSKRLLLLFVMAIFAATASMAQSSSDILNYINKYKDIALDQEKKYGVPATITLAQGILESGAGKSGLTRNANNHFGIKVSGNWTGPYVLRNDDAPNEN